MAEEGIDQIAAVKASLEMMVNETEEIHEYFRDLLAKVTELGELEPAERREKFQTLVDMGAFSFNGVDIRHLAHSQTQRPLPPPLFLSRTKRRLRNTSIIIDEFEKRDAFEGGAELRGEIEQLNSSIVDENNTSAVLEFKKQVEALRETELFDSYMDLKKSFIHKDTEFKADAGFIAAKESVEEGEEMLRQRTEELAQIESQMENGDLPVDEAQSLLDKMSFDKT